jgi:hypothetical protein
MTIECWNPDDEAIVKTAISNDWKITLCVHLCRILRNGGEVKEDLMDWTDRDARGRKTQYQHL